MEEEYKGAIAREQDLRKQLEELAKRYNEVVEQLNHEKLKAVSLQQELEKERSKRIALEEKLNVSGDKNKKRNRKPD
jgi:hypothetical protein